MQSCPTNAIEFSNDFEQAVFRREALVKQLNYLPEKDEPAPAPAPAAPAEAPDKATDEKTVEKPAVKVAVKADDAAKPANENQENQ